MNLLKKTDWIIQLLLILAATFLLLFNKPFSPGDRFIFPYLLLGGWQLLSAFVHFFLSGFTTSKLRKIYLWLLLLTVLAGITVWIADEDAILMYLFILLFWAPVLALIYFIASVYEWRQLNKTM